MEIHICSITEYDSITKIPTIQNPDEKTFYLVPSEDGTSPDLFVEWAYVNNAWEMFGSASIDLSGYLTDVQVNGTSIVSDGVANVPKASDNRLGCVMPSPNYGISIFSGGGLILNKAPDEYIRNGGGTYGGYRAIASSQTALSAFHGLALASGDVTQKTSTNTLGQYTPEAKGAIQSMLGIDSLIAPTETNPFSEAHTIGDLFIINGALYRAKTAIAVGDVLNDGVNVEVVDVAEVLDGKVDDVQINGASVVTDGVAEIPNVTASQTGLASVNTSYGIGAAANGSGILMIQAADSNLIKIATGYGLYKPIVPTHQHESVFYGLAKASGDTTQSQSDNAVGTYTNEAKTSIQTMLGVPSSDDVVSDVQINGTSILQDGVANMPIASANDLGVMKIAQNGGVRLGSTNNLQIEYASDVDIKQANSSFYPITPAYQHKSVFYGLARVAGDITQKTSSNGVGTYTDEAKTAIKQMLGVVDSYDSLVVNVTGTDPVITGSPSYRYNCGEVVSLTVTPPTSGTIDIIFTSGTTPTVLDLPQTVKMPSWWIGTEANTTYEICITDATYCGVMSWDV